MKSMERIRKSTISAWNIHLVFASRVASFPHLVAGREGHRWFSLCHFTVSLILPAPLGCSCKCSASAHVSFCMWRFFFWLFAVCAHGHVCIRGCVYDLGGGNGLDVMSAFSRMEFSRWCDLNVILSVCVHVCVHACVHVCVVGWSQAIRKGWRWRRWLASQYVLLWEWE